MYKPIISRYAKQALRSQHNVFKKNLCHTGLSKWQTNTKIMEAIKDDRTATLHMLMTILARQHAIEVEMVRFFSHNTGYTPKEVRSRMRVLSAQKFREIADEMFAEYGFLDKSQFEKPFDSED